MKKKNYWIPILLTIIFLGLLFGSLFFTISRSIKNNVTYVYALNAQGTWVDNDTGNVFANTDQPYLSILEEGCPEQILLLSEITSTAMEYGSATVYMENSVLHYEGTGDQEVLLRTDSAVDFLKRVELQGNGDTFHHYGDAKEIQLSSMDYGPFYEHGHTEQCTIHDGCIILEKEQDLEKIVFTTSEKDYSYSKVIIERLKGEALPALFCDHLDIEAGKTKSICKVQDVLEEITKTEATEDNGGYEVIQKFIDAKGIVKVEAKEDPTADGVIFVSAYIELEEADENQEKESVQISILN